jgi:hypothetical protein
LKPEGAVRFDEPRLTPVPDLFSFRNVAVIDTPGGLVTPAGTAAGTVGGSPGFGAQVSLDPRAQITIEYGFVG